MSTLARSTEIANELANALANDPWPGMPLDQVVRSNDIQIDADTFTGRRIYVVELGYGTAETTSRNEVINEYRYGIIYIERYTPDGRPTDAWVDDRKRWVEQGIWKKLTDVQTFNIVGNLWPETDEVSICDVQMLRQAKIFWSDVLIAYREIEA